MLAALGSGLGIRQAVYLPDARVAGPAYALFTAMTLMTAVLMASCGFGLAGHDFHVVAVTAAFMLLIAFGARGRGWNVLATALESLVLLYGFGVMVVLTTFVAATSGAPLMDEAFASMDRAMLPGLEWPSVMRNLATRPWLMKALDSAYASFGWQPFALLIALGITGRSERSWAFLLAWMVSLCLVTVVFALAPGLGAYHHFGMTPADVPGATDSTPWIQPEVLHALRRGDLREVAFVELEGIVTFPSFHTAAGVLLVWGWASIPKVRWLFALLNGTMVVSAVPIGGHYYVDIVGGVVVALLGLLIAKEVRSRIDGGGPRTEASPEGGHALVPRVGVRAD